MVMWRMRSSAKRNRFSIKVGSTTHPFLCSPTVHTHHRQTRNLSNGSESAFKGCTQQSNVREKAKRDQVGLNLYLGSCASKRKPFKERKNFPFLAEWMPNIFPEQAGSRRLCKWKSFEFKSFSTHTVNLIRRFLIINLICNSKRRRRRTLQLCFSHHKSW